MQYWSKQQTSNTKGYMDFKKIVEELLRRDERTVAWLARKLEKSDQNMRSHLKTNKPTIEFVEQVAGVFGISLNDFINVKCDLQEGS